MHIHSTDHDLLSNCKMSYSTSHFSKLPNELKTEVFKQLSQNQTRTIRGNLWNEGQKYWIDTARLVCREWNSLIISCSWIWRHIRLFGYSDDRLLLHLQRSGRAKLLVDVLYEGKVFRTRGNFRDCFGNIAIVERRLRDVLSDQVDRIEEFILDLKKIPGKR